MGDESRNSRLPTVDFSEFPQVGEMFAPGEFDLRLFLSANVSAVEGLAVARLLWPDFVEYRGGVFLDLVFEEAGIDRWFTQDDASIETVEGVVNHLHLWDVFRSPTDIDNRALVQLAQTMQVTWRAALAAKFPTRDFRVHLSSEPEDYGPTLTFTSVQ